MNFALPVAQRYVPKIGGFASRGASISGGSYAVATALSDDHGSALTLAARIAGALNDILPIGARLEGRFLCAIRAPYAIW